MLDEVTVPDRTEVPPVSGTVYWAFTDPSGGRNDSFTLAIAHREGDKAVLDLIEEEAPPFSPDAVVEKFARILKSYRLHEVVGDKYAGLWPTERFEAHGIKYVPSDMPKSEIYRTVLPLITGKTVELLNHHRMVTQFCSLERRVGRGGRDSIDHPNGSHDDVANCVAGALSLVDMNHRPQPYTTALMAGLHSIFNGMQTDQQMVERMYSQW